MVTSKSVANGGVALNQEIWITIFISSIVYWGFTISSIIIAFISARHNTIKTNSFRKETLHEKIYYGLCFFFDALGGYIFYVLCGFLIATFAKSVLLKIILFVPIWYISLQIAHRIMPLIVNRGLGWIMRIDKNKL